MLLISRRLGQRIVIGADVEVIVVSTTKKGARLAIVAPRGVAVIRGENFDNVQNANKNMRIEGTRFGTLEIENGSPIQIKGGMVGFPTSTNYLLLRSAGAGFGWLQSMDVPELAFPVVDGATVDGDSALPSTDDVAGTNATNTALFFVVAPTDDGGLVANLLAPVVIDMTSRQGSQVVLDGRRYSATEPLRIRAT